MQRRGSFLTRQTNNIVSFDEARRAVSARRPVASALRFSASDSSRGKVRSASRVGSAASAVPRSALYDELAYREDVRRARTAKASSARFATSASADRDTRARSRGQGSTDADQSFETFFGKMGERAQKAKREAAKARADREFTKHYGVDHAATPGDAGPRAAVYRGEMGSQHKRASRMQNEENVRNGGVSISTPSLKVSGLLKKPAFFGGLALAACALACGLFLYAPAQQYYLELRDRDRLAVEYELVSERNEAIAAEVALLSTPEGIQDRAREEFGWIAEGEHAVSVTGLSSEDQPAKFQANINSASVKAPETWYSDFLDSFFGYDR